MPLVPSASSAPSWTASTTSHSGGYHCIVWLGEILTRRVHLMRRLDEALGLFVRRSAQLERVADPLQQVRLVDLRDAAPADISIDD